MDKLYDLTFYSNPNGDYEDSFFIGLFLTQAEAEIVAERYRKEVPGFKDYDCDYRIAAFPVIGDADSIERVYRFIGWNTNEDLDEVDIIISSCFTARERAETEYQTAQEKYPREEWTLDCYTIGHCDWREGFVRCYPGGDE